MRGQLNREKEERKRMSEEQWKERRQGVREGEEEREEAKEREHVGDKGRRVKEIKVRKEGEKVGKLED